MMAVETGCLHLQSDVIADGDSTTKARTHLTDILRCASQLRCSRAVGCSDDAMAELRQLLGNDLDRD
ncbi:MAG TPA: hypothetical protein VK196_06820 [Magnetospirillum sp.]|nr:hypothetical protein [Magnetospirillum sp.]